MPTGTTTSSTTGDACTPRAASAADTEAEKKLKYLNTASNPRLPQRLHIR